VTESDRQKEVSREIQRHGELRELSNSLGVERYSAQELSAPDMAMMTSAWPWLGQSGGCVLGEGQVKVKELER
jgi:hypothetical protein